MLLHVCTAGQLQPRTLTIYKPDVMISFHLLVHAGDGFFGSQACQRQGFDTQGFQPQDLCNGQRILGS